MGYALVPVMLVLLIRSPSAFSQCKSSLEGREFVFGILDTTRSYPPWSRETSDDTINIHITNVSPNNTNIRLQIPYLNTDIQDNVQVKQSRILPVNSTIRRSGNFISRRGIRLTSDCDITVLVTCIKTFSNRSSLESYSILPVQSTGKRYSFTSPSNNLYADINHIVLIAAIYNRTRVKIYNTTIVVKDVSLDEFDVFHYTCSYNRCNMLVEAGHDVAVVSGSSIAYFQYSYFQREYLECMTSSHVPEAKWSKSYILPPLIATNAFEIKIVSENIFFKVTISNDTSAYVTLPENMKRLFVNTTGVVTAERPFAVAQFNYNPNGSPGDTFMVMTPGVDQYVSDYRFTVPQLQPDIPHSRILVTHYVAIIVPASQKYGLLIDDVPIHNFTSSIKQFSVPSPFDNYTVLSFDISEGYHRVHHSLPYVNFGLLVYGYGHPSPKVFQGYGFYAGFHLQGDGCAPTSTEVVTSTLSPVNTDSATLKVPSHYNNTLCYSCADLRHVELCDKLKECQRNEVCFVERQTKSGREVYRSGCLSSDICARVQHGSVRQGSTCIECCHGRLCNSQGCGDAGLPDRNVRGPVCFDCEHVWSPDECTSVSLCSTDQICRIEKFAWGDHYHYKMGCANSVCDPLMTRRVHHVSKRATPLCHSCCLSDYCNHNCSAPGAEGSVFIG